MARSPLEEGQFAWCSFPFRERPDEPGPEEHIAYVHATMEEPDGSLTVVAIFTTSQRQPPRIGTIKIEEAQALSMGQRKAFTIVASRTAFIPLNDAFFPRLDKADLVQGKADKNLKERIVKAIEAAVKRKMLEVHEPRRPGRTQKKTVDPRSTGSGPRR